MGFSTFQVTPGIDSLCSIGDMLDPANKASNGIPIKHHCNSHYCLMQEMPSLERNCRLELPIFSSEALPLHVNHSSARNSFESFKRDPIDASSDSVQGDDNYDAIDAPSDSIQRDDSRGAIDAWSDSVNEDDSGFVFPDELSTLVDLTLLQPTAENFLSILQECRKTKDIGYVKYVHMRVRNTAMECNSVLGNFLVQMYVACASMSNAQHVFDSLMKRNEHSWTSLLQGYLEQGNCQLVIDLFWKMQNDSVHPNKRTFEAVIKACAKLKSKKTGWAVHCEIVKEGFETISTIGNILVDMYSKCDSLVEARDVFNCLPCRDVVSWNTLIGGYTDHGLDSEALSCWDQMKLEGIFPDAITYLSILKACSSTGAVDKGQKAHADLSKDEVEGHPFLGSALVDMYAKCGLLDEAQEVFQELPNRNVVSWTALISGYANHGFGEKALHCFDSMKLEGVIPNDVTYICILKACSSLRAIEKGRELHTELVELKLERVPFLGSTLVDMYANCGSLVDAKAVFDELPVKCIVSWTALIGGYVDHGFDEEALNCLERMRAEEVHPNAVTFVCSLKACGNLAAIETGRAIHEELVREGLEGSSIVLNSLVSMYSKCHLLDEAWDVFNDSPSQDTISWHAMISAYIEQGEYEDALLLSLQMQEQGLLPGNLIFVSMLKACGTSGALENGKKVHAQLCRATGLEVATAFIDMYGKCGSMNDAQRVFDAVVRKDIVIWTALLAGYAQQGESELVLHLFRLMREAGMHPNGITFLSILTACSHAGLVEKGHEYFEVMSKEYGISPTIKHHNCMVDLLGRAGQSHQAIAVLEKVPFQIGKVTWSTMLGACRDANTIEIARHAFDCALNLDREHPALFILMSNLYAVLNEGRYVED